MKAQSPTCKPGWAVWGVTARGLLSQQGLVRVRRDKEEKNPAPNPALMGVPLPRNTVWLKYLCFTDGETEAGEQEAATLHG